jgi:hypothetical protein
VTSPAIPRLPDIAFPFYVQTDKQRERWELSHAIAEAISAENEPDGRPNTLFVWHMTRHLFSSEMPTGSVDDQPAYRIA